MHTRSPAWFAAASINLGGSLLGRAKHWAALHVAQTTELPEQATQAGWLGLWHSGPKQLSWGWDFSIRLSGSTFVTGNFTGGFGGKCYLLGVTKIGAPPYDFDYMYMNFGSQLYFWKLVWVIYTLNYFNTFNTFGKVKFFWKLNPSAGPFQYCAPTRSMRVFLVIRQGLCTMAFFFKPRQGLWQFRLLVYLKFPGWRWS